MMISKDLIIIFLLITSFITISISMYTFKKNDGKTAMAFALLMLAASVHSFGYTFEMLSRDPKISLLWLNFEYIGISFFPFLLLYFVLEHKREDSVIRIITLIIFFAFSLMTFFMVQTNTLHHLYYKSITFDVTGELTRAIIDRGIWYYVHVGVSFIAIAISNVINMDILRKSKDSYRGRAIFTSISLMIPAVVGMLYIFNLSPAHIDVTAFAYAPMGIIWVVGLIKFGIFELIPITYKEIFEHISEGVIVLDKNDTIINFNSAACNILQPIHKLYKGHEVRSVLSKLKFITNGDYQGKVFEIRRKSKYKIYQLKRTNMFDCKNRYVGKILMLNDITMESESKKVLTTLATRDELTGISNRRHFFELCNQKIIEARQNKINVSFVIMDIDYFKQVNDTYGHLVGDQVLREVTEICRNGLRTTDLIGRYGGEEFAILIYDTGVQVTHNIIERMRFNISNHVFKVNETEAFQLTVSFGVYRPDMIKEEKLDIIFKKADIGLYKAKSNGRDRVIFYTDHIG